MSISLYANITPMLQMPAIAVLATLDTKGREAEFLAHRIEDRGRKTTIIDIGLLGTPLVRADISRADVARAAPGGPRAVAQDRETAMNAVAEGAAELLRGLFSRGELAGVVALGGSKGTWMATSAMRQLPWGLPKMMVAATVPTDLRHYSGTSDLVFFSSVVDLAGLNSMTELLLTRAAAMIAAAVSATVDRQPAGPAVAMTMAGVVTACGLRVEQGLRDRGFEPVVLPANGVGGEALEEMVNSGVMHGVVDLALQELSNQVVGGVCVAGPDRLEGASRLGLPQVIVPGGTDFANFAGRSGVPAHYRERKLIDHTPAVTLMRLTAAESNLTGQLVGKKIAAGKGATEVIIPLRGFSSYDQSGAPFADPAADLAFVEGLRDAAQGDVVITERDEHINDPAFADVVVATFARLSDSVARPPVAGANEAEDGRVWA
jgi:uncharacterized protein (UPF0261 family)